ncbi:MAG: T9SS type A sorting domain-containing protein [Bacteroidia bacterium]|nr:T9SS type A sorting domain-containing protein [Bacteroidia bacterium]
MRTYLHTVLLLLISVAFAQSALAQARIVIDGAAYIVLNGGTSSTPIYVVQDNGNTNAIIRNTASSGHIVTEGEYNLLKWNIGTNTGSYIAPFGRGTAVADTTFMRFNISAAGTVGSGFKLSTYRTATWDNNSYKPSVVTHMYKNGTTSNNSNKTIDRFYQAASVGYTTQPTINKFILSYIDVEHSVANNAITEANLGAQYWKETAPIGWQPNAVMGAVNTSANCVTVTTSLPNLSDVHWWTLVDNSSPLPVTLTQFKATCQNNQTQFNFTTATETNSNYFVIAMQDQPTKPLIPLHKIQAAGFSTQNINYAYTYNGTLNSQTLFYLQQTDLDGNTTTYGPYPLNNPCNNNTTETNNAVNVQVFPNPAKETINIRIRNNKTENTSIQITNAIGQLIYNNTLTLGNEYLTVPVNSWTKGVYFVTVWSNQTAYKTTKIAIENNE